MEEDTHAKRTLANIEALMEGRSTIDQNAYQLGGRRLDRIPIPDLIQLHKYYSKLVYKEKEGAKTVQNITVIPQI